MNDDGELPVTSVFRLCDSANAGTWSHVRRLCVMEQTGTLEYEYRGQRIEESNGII